MDLIRHISGNPRLRTWLPLVLGGASLVVFCRILTLGAAWRWLEWPSFLVFAGCILFIFGQFCVRLYRKQWKSAAFAALRVAALGGLFILAGIFVFMFSMFGPSEDHFADNLIIPDDIEIFEPEARSIPDRFQTDADPGDAMQLAVRAVLSESGGNDLRFSPSLPSLRQASTQHEDALSEYLEASPDWHVFMQRGNRFASRRWSRGGEPQDTLHGYISEFGGDSAFQTRTLICIDRKGWSRYNVQHVQESNKSIEPRMTQGNRMHESRVMIECGGVWVEIFEQSKARERRVTKASLQVLEEEFSRFFANPAEAISAAKQRSRDLTMRHDGDADVPFHLADGMQPGIYEVNYMLNPGEPGEVYLKAYEVTQGTPLSVGRLAERSRTRMPWSRDLAERYAAKAGFTIFEGDWGKPYAARFEVWFKPDSGSKERKLAERNYKIEGWQR